MFGIRIGSGGRNQWINEGICNRQIIFLALNSFRPVEPIFMKSVSSRLITITCLFIVFFASSCKLWNNAFGPKYGCPGNGKAVGAERILAGEKVPKAKKFKVHQ